jgi:hypothetical protein
MSCSVFVVAEFSCFVVLVSSMKKARVIKFEKILFLVFCVELERR